MKSKNSNYVNMNWNLDSFPEGYRFVPWEGELLVHYLRKKLRNEPLPPSRIMEVNLYQYSPEELEEPRVKDKFFFTQRDRKHLNGKRPNRVTGSGYWKTTGGDKKVKYGGKTVGFKKTLVFYRRIPVGPQKTNWITHEFRDNNSSPSKKDGTDMKIDWVLCRIRQRLTERDHDDDVTNEPMNLDPVVNSTEHANPSSEMRIIRFGSQAQFYAQSSYANSNNMNQQNTVPEIPSIMPPPDLSQFSGDMHQQNTLQEMLHFDSTNGGLVNSTEYPFSFSYHTTYPEWSSTYQDSYRFWP